MPLQNSPGFVEGYRKKMLNLLLHKKWVYKLKLGASSIIRSKELYLSLQIALQNTINLHLLIFTHVCTRLIAEIYLGKRKNLRNKFYQN